METFNVIIPIFVFLAGGFLCRRFKVVSLETKNFLNNLVYYAAMPAMIFKGIVSFDFQSTFRLDIVAQNLLTTLVVFLLTFGVSFLIKDPKKRGAFHMGCFRSNQGYMGLPVVDSFFGARAVSITSLINGFDSPYCVILSIVALEIFRTIAYGNGNKEGAKKLLLSKLFDVIKNPFLIATVLGFICVWLKLNVLSLGFVRELLTLTSNISMPLSLFVIGCSINFGSIRKNVGIIASVSAIKLVLAPVIGFIIGVFIFSLSGEDLAFSVLLVGMPSSVSSYALAAQMDTDDELMASIIGITTALSIITIPIVYNVLKVIA